MSKEPIALLTPEQVERLNGMFERAAEDVRVAVVAFAEAWNRAVAKADNPLPSTEEDR